ncbi:MAG: sigma-70 family RNA polymerase sigma factor [Planctomycetota bacterium]
MPRGVHQPEPPPAADRTAHRTGPTMLERIAAGDAEAVRPVLDAYGGLVWSIVRSSLSSPAQAADAEEVVQDVFASVWRDAHRFDPARGSEKAFIATITRRRVIDRLRLAAPPTATAAPLDAAELAAAGATSLDEQVREVARCFDALPQSQRGVLRLFIVEGRTHEQISAATGVPLGTVKSHIRRGLAQVREMLEAGEQRPSASREASS